MEKLSLILTLSFISLFSLSSEAVPAQGTRLAISGPSPWIGAVSKDILDKGGNAADVAVATALSLAVTHPYYASLGGGGFALVRINGKTDALDFREVAPSLASSQMFAGQESQSSITGGLAVAVPGVPAGLKALHAKYGKLPWSRLFVKAIELAEKGFPVSGEWVDITNSNQTRFNGAARKLFSKDGTAPLKAGEMFKQKELARLLKEMSNRGLVPFYEGMPARAMVDAVQSAGGKLTRADLKSYKARWLKPLEVQFHGNTVFLMPPPSSGGVVLTQMLSLMERSSLHSEKPLSAAELHLLAEIEKLSFQSRGMLGDPAFSEMPLERLLSEKFINDSLHRISPDKAIDISRLPSLEAPPTEGSNTTHFSLLMANGDAVAMTLTLNGNYGSGVATNSYGIILNNQMDDFTTKPGQPNMFGLIQGKANEVAPGKRPLSSMSPTIVVRDGKTQMALGAPGGPRIISAVGQVLYRVFQVGWNIDESVQAPRVHHQFQPNHLIIEPRRLAPEVVDALVKKGHVIEENVLAKVYVARRSADRLEATHDARGEGASFAY